ncbi:MAG: MarR family transcriptional regulator [Phycisphaerales bacterium]|nr:MarR family transcriptional regulator [Phycisphaerales bacterium]
MARSLKDQINKTNKFSSSHEEAMLNLYRTAAHLSAPEQSLLKKYKLSPASYNLLRILRGHHLSGEHEGVRASNIGCEMVVRMPDVTRLVDRLESMKLVSRRSASDDKRVKYVKISKKGIETLSKIDPEIDQLIVNQLGHMSSDEMESLSRLLEKIRREDYLIQSSCDHGNKGNPS